MSSGASPDLLTFPASERNAPHIVEKLRELVFTAARGEAQRVLEVASGGGQHVVRWAAEWPAAEFQPSDVDELARASVAERARRAGLANVRAPLALDAAAEAWPGVEEGAFDAVCNVNMIHISPEACMHGLFRGAARALRPGGLLYTYGPYAVDGDLLSDGNRAFDASLRGRNPEWGIRDVRDVEAAARRHGLEPAGRHQMPANNLSLLFVRR